MKITSILTFIILLVLGGVSCSRQQENAANNDDSTNAAAASTEAGAEYYTCPMHPSVVSDRPGACPVCGMALVRKSKQTKTTDGNTQSLQHVSLSPTQRVIANIATMPIGRDRLKSEIGAVGVVDFAEPLQAKVTARFNGRIEKLYVNFTGANVRAGDPLFELHSPDLISAEQELILALSAQRNSSDPNQQQLLEAARERLHIHFGLTHEQIEKIEQEQSAHETMTFRSPISGTVITKEVQEGQYVNEGMLLYQLADLSKVWVYLDVYERDLPSIAQSSNVSVLTEALPEEAFKGKITFIDPVINPETRTARVRTELRNPGGKLKPQMYVRATIQSQASGRTLTVPTTAVMHTGSKNIVWVEVTENTFEPREVALGVSSDGMVEVLRGLQDGDVVVTTGGFLLESESQLQQPAATTGSHQHGSAPSSQQPQQGASSEVRVVVGSDYSPGTIRAKSGRKLTLVFERHDESACTEEIVLQDFNIRRKLPLHQKTAIEITPQKPGEYRFTCGMGMLEGKILVE